MSYYYTKEAPDMSWPGPDSPEETLRRAMDDNDPDDLFRYDESFETTYLRRVRVGHKHGRVFLVVTSTVSGQEIHSRLSREEARQIALMLTETEETQ